MCNLGAGAGDLGATAVARNNLKALQLEVPEPKQPKGREDPSDNAKEPASCLWRFEKAAFWKQVHEKLCPL